MEGDPHKDDFNGTANFDAVIELFNLERASGGGW